ncbi:MAG: HD domain-containing protein [Proteobacteria bacterium]|nr:HD domain-containing protein [Pseudomonadota bacterium]
MSRKFINELKENDHVENVFFVAEKSLGTGKTGKSFLSLKLSDKSGILDGKIWDRVEHFNNLFERDDFVFIKGIIQSYQGTFQIIISDIRKAQEKEINLEHFIPDSGKDIEKLWQAFLDECSIIKDPYLKKLFSKIFIEDQEIQEKFRNYPAAKSLHHAYKGGLLEHSLNIVKLAKYICNFYEYNINRDLLVIASALHDIGKIYELNFSYITSYTTDGKLLGHIILADELIIRKSFLIENFPQKTLNLLRHILISHHGEYEYGSPKRPKTLEALIIHFLDNLDAKINGFISALEKDTQNGDWTGVVKSFDRQLYKGTINGEYEDEVVSESKETNTIKSFNPVLKNINFELFKDRDKI